MEYVAQARRHQQGCEVEDLGSRRVRLSYDPDDPYAVALEVFHTDAWARWVFARSLLVHVPSRGKGLGAVHVCPAPGMPRQRVSIILRTAPGVGFELVLRRAEVDAAVDRFDHVVAIGSESEYIDWETELAALGGGEA
ncbi:hypothetical protein BAY61_01325 [Prauserella marina]|nr:hypothetical protein BAY61_01325 [Prauserella marina]